MLTSILALTLILPSTATATLTNPLSPQLNCFFDLYGLAVARRCSLLVGAHRTLFVAACHWLQIL